MQIDTSSFVASDAIDVTHNLSHNGIAGSDDEIKFLNYDPQLIIKFKTPVNVEHVILNYESAIHIHNVQEQKLQFLQNQIEEHGFKLFIRFLKHRLKRMLSSKKIG